ncbi:MAG: hypothetical protein ACK4P3_06290 [Fimbriimonadaceae bacterium]
MGSTQSLPSFPTLVVLWNEHRTEVDRWTRLAGLNDLRAFLLRAFEFGLYLPEPVCQELRSRVPTEAQSPLLNLLHGSPFEFFDATRSSVYGIIARRLGCVLVGEQDLPEHLPLIEELMVRVAEVKLDPINPTLWDD